MSAFCAAGWWIIVAASALFIVSVLAVAAWILCCSWNDRHRGDDVTEEQRIVALILRDEIDDFIDDVLSGR